MDAAFLERLKGRDPQAQAELQREVLGDLRACSQKIVGDAVTAEQVAADVLTDFLVDHVDKVRNARGVRAYLRMTAVRRCVHLRRQAERFEELEEPTGSTGGEEAALVDVLDQPRFSQWLEECMRKVNPRVRHYLRMRYFHDMSLEAIGTAVGVSKQYTGRVLQKALDLLRRCVSRRVK